MGYGKLLTLCNLPLEAEKSSEVVAILDRVTAAARPAAVAAVVILAFDLIFTPHHYSGTG